MPRATQPAFALILVALDAALPQWATLVRALAVKCADLALVAGQSDGLGAGLHRTHLAIAQLVRLGHLVPDRLQAILLIEFLLRNLFMRTVTQW